MSELTLDPALLSELSTQNQEQLHSHQNQKDAIQSTQRGAMITE